MPETDFKYDVFISYSHKDEEWADKILRQRLDDAGFKVCIDYRDFEAGKMALLNMQDAVKQSKHVVLVLTRNWLNSEWSLFEALMGGTEDPAGLQKKLIPLLCEDGIQRDINPFISMRTWADFTRKDREDIAWRQLFAALGKPEAFQPSNVKPETGSRDYWHLAHPYPMPPNFTGRADELKMLDDWLSDDTNRLFILRALGGFGKSALAWQWINTHVNPAEWTKLVWWSFYEGDASFEHFIEETLKYLKLEIPQGQRLQVDELLKAMQGQKILVIMDGFERTLRTYGSMNTAYQVDEESRIDGSQFDCVNFNAEIFLRNLCSLPNIKSKVLMTTRLTPRAIKPRGEFMLGCQDVELTSMQPADAVEFFHKRGIKGTRAEIEAACTPYGYHPLSLSILAALIVNSRETPGDIIVVDSIDITDNIVLNKHHILDVSYNALSFGQQKLLSNMACFRSSISYAALKVITNKPSWRHKNKKLLNENLDNNLHNLEQRGVIRWDKQLNRYSLHPIVRRYAYKRLAGLERTTAHKRLRDYFISIRDPDKPATINDLINAIELFYHTARAEKYDEAFNYFYKHLNTPLYFQFGQYQTFIELQAELFDERTGKGKIRNQTNVGSILNNVANSYCMMGQVSRGIHLFELSVKFEEEQGNRTGLAIHIANLGCFQLPIGKLMLADSNVRRSIEIFIDIKNKRQEMISKAELGRALTYRGVWGESQNLLNEVIEWARTIGDEQMQIVAWDHFALSEILQSRSMQSLSTPNPNQIMEYAKKPFEFFNANQISKGKYNSYDIVRAHWLLGKAYFIEGNLNEADFHLGESLKSIRNINAIEDEPSILVSLAHLRYRQKNYEEAKSFADEALTITERCGYVLQGADVNLFLAEYALEQEKDKAKAKQYAEEARKLATCDGPPYYYKVAYEEAERLIEKLK